MNDILILCIIGCILACFFLIGLAISSTYADIKYEETNETRSLRDAIRRAEREEGLEGK